MLMKAAATGLAALDWYALTTAVNREFVVRQMLRDRGLMSACPCLVRNSRASRHVRKREPLELKFPLLVRYVLLGFDPAIGDRWGEVERLSQRGLVTGIVGFGGVPRRMVGEEVAKFIARYGDGPDLPRLRDKGIAAGELMEITTGPYRGHLVRVREVRGYMARILLPLFGGLDAEGKPVVREVTIPVANLQ